MSATLVSKIKGYLTSRLPWIWLASACGLALPIVAPLLAESTLAWVADLAIHWQWQYTALALSISLIHLAMQRSLLALVMVITTLVMTTLNFGPLSLGRISSVNREPSLSVASFNLNLDNHQAPGLDNWVASEGPDVLALFEVTPQHAPLIERLKGSLRYVIKQQQDDQFGVAVLSRIPFDGAQVKTHKGSNPYIEAKIKIHGTPVLLRAIHPMPPISESDRAKRDELISAVAQRGYEPLLILGDFNASPWTLAMRELSNKGIKRATSLQPTHTLYGGLPIDHILATEAHWQVVSAGTGGDFGSDHRLVWASLRTR